MRESEIFVCERDANISLSTTHLNGSEIRLEPFN